MCQFILDCSFEFPEERESRGETLSHFQYQAFQMHVRVRQSKWPLFVVHQYVSLHLAYGMQAIQLETGHIEVQIDFGIYDWNHRFGKFQSNLARCAHDKPVV